MIGVFQRRLPVGDMAISVVVLCAFAISQPLLDLLGRNAEFFLARASSPTEIVLVGLLLALVVPLLPALVVVLIARLHEPSGRIVHWVLVTLFGGVFVLQVMEQTSIRAVNDYVEIGVSAAIGFLLACALYRYQPIRTFLRFGLAAPVIFLGSFVFFSPVSRLIFESGGITEPAAITVENPMPVVFVIFDEFPVASLIDEQGRIDEAVFPNFARLAEDGTWYRNAITVQQQTEESVPAILTGVDGSADRLPFASDYPANLFTLLSEHYEIRAVEQVTEMCPDYACDNAARPRAAGRERWETLLSDLWIVSGHVVLPSGMRSGLPPIDHSWSNFGAGVSEEQENFDIVRRFNQTTRDDRRIPFQALLEEMAAPTVEPTFDFIHVMLPHFPWQFVSTGQKFYSLYPIPGSVTTGWGTDLWLINQGYQRHLMQVQYVDSLVGQLIERMEEIGTYDSSLIVIVADHGIAIKPNIEHRRTALENTIGDVVAIPLFIKTPHQEEGGPDDYRAETVDILPTIADSLGIVLPWETDGTSLLDPQRPVRTQSQITGKAGVIEFGVDGHEKLEIAAAKVEAFGGSDPYGLAPSGHHDLLWTSPAVTAAAEDLTVAIDNPGRFRNVDLEADSLPLQFFGTLRASRPLDGEKVIAVALNGEIVAVTRSFDTSGTSASFYAMLPHHKLVQGENEFEVYLVEGAGADRTLSIVPTD